MLTTICRIRIRQIDVARENAPAAITFAPSAPEHAEKQKSDRAAAKAPRMWVVR
jgi:hypothetical protein